MCDISQSIDANGLTEYVHVYPYGVGNKTESFESEYSLECLGAFRVGREHRSQHDEYHHYTSKMHNKSHHMMNVTVISIDDLFSFELSSQTMPQILMIKIDTEGYESKIIAGMSNLLRSGVIHELCIEVTPEYWMHYSKFSRDIIAEIFVTRLWDNGFQNITIFGNRVYHKKQWV